MLALESPLRVFCDLLDVEPSARSPIEVSGAGRVDLAAAFRTLGYCTGAEVGVERGDYSEVLCREVPGLDLLCVDAWVAYRGYREHVTQEKLDGFYALAQARLGPLGCRLARGWSTDVAATVEDGSLDFVYIDANHRYEQVVADLAAWVPKVRPGGIVAGHDYRKSKGDGPWHVPYAVQGWTGAYRIAPWFVLRGDSAPSWCWVVPS